MGLEGRTNYATQSRILRGRDPRSIRVLIPVGQGPDQSVHDVTILDMGNLPEPHVTVLQLAELIHKPHDVATARDRMNAECGEDGAKA